MTHTGQAPSLGKILFLVSCVLMHNILLEYMKSTTYMSYYKKHEKGSFLEIFPCTLIVLTRYNGSWKREFFFRPLKKLKNEFIM